MERPEAPRALRGSTREGRLLRALDVPEDCGCPLPDLPRGASEEVLSCLPPAVRFLAEVFGRMEDPVRRRPCVHTREAGEAFARAGLGLDEWIELLEHFDPDGMAERPLPAPHALASHAGRIAEYHLRAMAGQAIFHPCDMKPEDAKGVGVRGGKRKRQEAVEDSSGDSVLALGEEGKEAPADKLLAEVRMRNIKRRAWLEERRLARGEGGA